MAPTQEVESDYVTEIRAVHNPIIEFQPPEGWNVRDNRADGDTLPNLMYQEVELPQLPNLKQLLQNATGTDNLESVVEVKLQVIAHEVGLQHLGVHIPALRELTLDGSAILSLRDLGCCLKNVKILRVNRCGLISLDGVTGVPNLEDLSVARNMISDLTPCAFLRSIKHIDARRNILRNIEVVSYLSLSDTLEHLDLDDNQNLSTHLDYRESVKKALPNLKTLDGVEFTEEECGKPSTCKSDRSMSASHKELNLPPINTSRRSSAGIGGSSSCSYSVSFSPRVLSPRSELSESSSKSDIKVKKTEFPKL